MLEISNIWFLQTSCLTTVTVTVSLVLGMFFLFTHLCFGSMMTFLMVSIMVMTYIVMTGLIHCLLTRTEAINLSLDNIVRLLDSLNIHPLKFIIRPLLECLQSLSGSEDNDKTKQECYLQTLIANIDLEDDIGK